MASQKEARKLGTRSPLWSKELFREEIETADSISSICRRWSSDPDKIQGHRNDIVRWRKTDPELDARCREKFKTPGTGRPSLEKEQPDWRLAFCEAYLRTKSRVKAAEATPYAYDSILKKLDPNKTEYDKLFVDMLAQTEARLLDRAEQLVYESLELEPSHRNKAWIALQLLRVRDRARFGDKLDIKFEGTMRHEIDRGKVLNELASSQEKFFEKTRVMLESENVIEAEIVSDPK